MARASNTTIIKRIEGDHHDGHHGGAWKVAYADFMTAMMAFFLLLWILSSSDEQKLKGIAEYFTDATQPGGTGVLDGASIGPPGILSASNGTILARGNEIGEVDQTVTAKWEVRDVTDASEPQSKPQQENTASEHDGSREMVRGFVDEQDPLLQDANSAGLEANLETTIEDAATEGDARPASGEWMQDEKRFEELQADVLQAMQENPDLRPLKENLVFTKTDAGLEIQVIDQEGQPMFASGEAVLLEATELLMMEIGRALSQLPNQLVISGHTDAVPFSDYANYDNWDLSSDRANAARRIMMRSGVDPQRLMRVSGKAHTEPLLADTPNDPANRRISLLLQYTAGSVNNADLKGTKLAAHDRGAPAPVEARAIDQETLDNLRSVLR